MIRAGYSTYSPPPFTSPMPRVELPISTMPRRSFGRRPRLNIDRWCGSWKLFRPDGAPLPQDQYPVALTLPRREILSRPAGRRGAARRYARTLHAFPTPFYDPSGSLVGAVNVLVDVSEHQRAERVERRLAAIVESSDDAIISKDLNGIIATWNKAAERLFGYAADEVVGKSITIVIPPERRHEEIGILDRIRRGEPIDISKPSGVARTEAWLIFRCPFRR